MYYLVLTGTNPHGDELFTLYFANRPTRHVMLGWIGGQRLVAKLVALHGVAA